MKPDEVSPSTENIEIASKDDPDDFTKVELSPKKDVKRRPQYSGGGFIEPPRDPLAPITDRTQDVKKSVPNNPLLTKIPPGSKESVVSGDGLNRVSQHLTTKRLSHATLV